jgi:AcrR family transcriptional regulator
MSAPPAVFNAMTNDDIIKAALKVWGRELYQTTSLSQVAQELGVSKAALYRHFKDKEALMEAIYAGFYDDFAVFIKSGYEKALKIENKNERGFYINQLITEYYIRNRESFVFFIIQVFKNQRLMALTGELRARGVDFAKLMKKDDLSPQIPVFLLISVTMNFWVAKFHRFGYKPVERPSEEQIEKALASINSRVLSGLGLQAEKVDALDYAALERQASHKAYEETEDNKLLRAVAGAVAEAGPWNASMEMVARRSGLSKSGLYAHFKNKNDMLAQLFVSEFTRIMDYAWMNITGSETPEEQLYLVIISIADYLRSRPEILIALDWVKTRRLETGLKDTPRVKHPVFSQDITTINLNVLKGPEGQKIAHWILFMIVVILLRGEASNQIPDASGPEPSGPEGHGPGVDGPKVHGPEVRCFCAGQRQPHTMDFSAVTNESFRTLYRYITLGLKGFNL